MGREALFEFGAQKSVEPWHPREYDAIMKRLPTLKTMERALKDRDPGFDGIFFIAVKTTGIFCRPSCPAKTALTRNRRYFPTPRDAMQAGFRPCRRCRPLDANGRHPTWVV